MLADTRPANLPFSASCLTLEHPSTRTQHLTLNVSGQVFALQFLVDGVVIAIYNHYDTNDLTNNSVTHSGLPSVDPAIAQVTRQMLGILRIRITREIVNLPSYLLELLGLKI